MKKLLNTLYITDEKSFLSKDGENIVILKEGIEIKRFPIHILDSIICFSYIGASPAVMKMCSERCVDISFVTPNGRFCGKLVGAENGNVLLRRRQYVMADNNESIEFVRNIIYAKGQNSKKVLRRAMIDHRDKVNIEKLDAKIESIEESLCKIKQSQTKDSIRGLEGMIAKEYFDCFNDLIIKQKEDFCFTQRMRRPPRDPVNTMLSFLYTILGHDVASALASVGVDSYVGFFHTDRPGRMSMALDMIEELRAYMVDRAVLSMINLRIISLKDFMIKENNTVLLTDNGRKKIIENWQRRKQIEIRHPFLNEKIKVGLIPYVQASLLNRYIRGDLDSYPPFLIKE